MFSKKDSKRIQQLYQKKFRQREGLFVAETPKVVEEFLKEGFIVDQWIATEDYVKPNGVGLSPDTVSSQELKGASRLQSPNGTLAVFQIPEELPIENVQFALGLDGVRDPGNMGTIIRLADWFAVDALYLSPDCVDIWNPKVVQSTMGSLARVQPVTTELLPVCKQWKDRGAGVYVADMEGESIYGASFEAPCLVIMGNEANGPDATLTQFAQTITIPRFKTQGAESLNVAMATSIILSQAKRPSS